MDHINFNNGSDEPITEEMYNSILQSLQMQIGLGIYLPSDIPLRIVTCESCPFCVYCKEQQIHCIRLLEDDNSDPYLCWHREPPKNE